MNQRIAILCGSLEQGKDGVGDYSLRLAGELSLRGFSIHVIALHDRHVKSLSKYQINVSNQKLDCLRIPSTLDWNEKAIQLEKYNAEFKFELVSIQFVPYAFNDKGLPFKLADCLKKGFGISTFHIMFHELWLGIEINPPLKYRLYGAAQKNIIRNLLRTLNIRHVSANSTVYVNQLRKIGVKAEKLPLFSNISFAKDSNLVRHPDELRCIIFGYISPSAPFRQFFIELKDHANKNGLKAIVLFAGKNGNESKLWQAVLDELEMSYENLGFLSETELSKCMQEVDFGIATTPIELYEKSGALCAMETHGLPVVNVAKETMWGKKLLVDFNLPDWLHKFEKGNLENFFNPLKAPLPGDRLPMVTDKLLSQLKMEGAPHA